MAAARSKLPAGPVGSANWVRSVNDEAEAMVANEAWEYHHSVHNELEWLNEHMAGIYSESFTYEYQQI